MKKILALTIIFTSLSLFAQSKYYTISFTIGRVYLRSANSKVWKAAKVGDTLKPGCILKTTENSRLQLTRNNEKITIKDQTVIPLNDLEKARDKKKFVELSSKMSRVITSFFKENNVTPPTATGGVRGEAAPGDPHLSWSDDLEDNNDAARFKNARISFSGGNYQGAISYLEPLLSTIEKDNRNEALFIIGTSYFNLGNFEKSIAFLQQIESKTKEDRKYATSAHFLIAIAYNYSGDDKKSMEQFFLFIKKYPQHSLTPKAYYMIASQYKFRNQKARAKKYYSIILKDYPDSDISKATKKEIKELK